MTLRQLRAFGAVAALRSYSRAAERLGLTQPAVSAQVRALERTLGQPLVEFVGRGLYLTPHGEALEAAALDVFRRLDALLERLAELEGAVRGRLRLAAVTSAGHFVPHLVAAFRRELPEVEVAVALVNRAQALERLAANTDDLTLMALVPEDRALEYFPLLDNELVLVARGDHPLAGRRRVDPARLEAHTVIVREPGSGTRRALEDALEARRVRLARTLEIGSNEAVREAVRAGLGLALLPRPAVHRELAASELVALDVRGFPLRRSWCVVYPRGKALTPVARRMVEFLRRRLASLSAELAEAALPAEAPQARTRPAPER